MPGPSTSWPSQEASRPMPARTRVHDLTCSRIERALAKRARYRYVQPRVEAAEGGWLISSPCCSRNVDPEGGEIAIAWLQEGDEGWRLYSRDHSHGRWVLHGTNSRLPTLLDAICKDSERKFWP
jgi:hypothetical protein